MGIMAPIARAILREHKFRPIAGDGLLIGRQTIPLTLDEAKQMLVDEGVQLRAEFDVDADWIYDGDTRSAVGHRYISDRAFFAMFSSIKLKTLDVTDYENAEIIHDMHLPLPDEFKDRFDFIWNGSCLDNMSDPGMAMRSTAQMLKSSGRVICMEMATPDFDAYVTFSQAWFFDFFAVNHFEDCKVYTLNFDPKKIFRGDYHLFVAKNFEAQSVQSPIGVMRPRRYARMTFVIAEKGTNSTSDTMPIQRQYRPDDILYKTAYDEFSTSLRPILKFPRLLSSFWVKGSRSAKYLGVLKGV